MWNGGVVLAVDPAFPQRLSFQTSTSCEISSSQISSPVELKCGTTLAGELDREELFEIELDLPATFGQSEIRGIVEIREDVVPMGKSIIIKGTSGSEVHFHLEK